MDRYQRNKKSHFHTVLYQVWGGELWVRYWLRLGHVHQDAVAVVNTVAAKRAAAATAVFAGCRRLRGPSAPPRGITHFPSRGKQLREAAKLRERNHQEHQKVWRRARDEAWRTTDVRVCDQYRHDIGMRGCVWSR